MSNDATREALAAYAHEAWAGWMIYLFKHGAQNKDGTFSINASQVERWRRQMCTPYAELTEGEKGSDRAEADKMISISATRIAALEAQVAAAQKANTDLINRIVELEHQLESASGLIIRYARLVGMQLESVSSFPPPRAVDPGRLCDHCGLPLISAHIADEVIIASGERRARVHRVCASAYPGWTVVVTARGGV